ncbi:Uncharacterised protein [uncultured archaeon]|nr:Uncharacterised protein [uncultured archaeon]
MRIFDSNISFEKQKVFGTTLIGIRVDLGTVEVSTMNYVKYLVALLAVL